MTLIRFVRRPLRILAVIALLAAYGGSVGCEHKVVVDRDHPDFHHDDHDFDHGYDHR